MSKQEQWIKLTESDEDTANRRKKERSANKKRRWIVLVSLAVCVFCVIIGILIWNGMQSEQDYKTISQLLGADKIYPTIMVQGKLYEWRRGRAICDELPVGSIYYGKIDHIEEEIPQKDCQFVSVFSAEGLIFISPEEDCVYLYLTTDWMTDTVVAFDFVNVEE